MEKIGIFGGTFNPPHIGHVNSAKDFVAKTEIDKLLIIPTNLPPHKDYNCEASAEQRLQMSRLAFGDVEGAEVSDVEICRGGKSYTYITLEELSREGRTLYLLCGTDMFLTLDGWKNAERIFALATVCYVRRENDDSACALLEAKAREYREKYGARVVPVSNSVIEISSSELREMLARREGAERFIPKDVYDYILEQELYL